MSWKPNYSAAREAATVFAGQAINGLVLFLGLKCLTNVLNAENFGHFALGLTVSIIAGQLLFGPMSAAILRVLADAKAPVEYRQACGAVVRSMIRIQLYALGIGLAGGIFVTVIRVNELLFFTISWIASIFIGATQTFEAALSARRSRQIVALSTAGGQILRIGLATFFGTKDGVIGAMSGYAAGSFIHLCLVTTYTYINIKPILGSAGTWDRNIFIYIKPFIIWGVPSAIFFSIDRWSIEWYTNAKQVALYSAAQQLTQQPVSFLFSVASLFAAPQLFAKASESTGRAHIRKQLMMSTIIIIIAAGLGLAVLITWAKPIMVLLTRPSYIDGYRLLPRVFISAIFFQIGQWWALAHLGAKKPNRLILPKTVQAMIGSVAVVIAAKEIGAEGVANALIIVNFAYASWIYWDAQHNLNLSTDDADQPI